MKAMKFLVLLFPVVMLSCSKSGKKALESGEYYQAALQSIEKLRKDSDNDKSLEVLPNAYKLAQEDLLRDISRAKMANQQFKYERVVDDYAKLNELHDRIEKCNACRKIVSPDSYFREYEDAVELAATERYDYADALLRRGTIESGRTAFESFNELIRYAPNYKDVGAKAEEALFLGSYHVVVEQPGINSKMYQYSNDFFRGKIDEFLQTNRRLNKFIRFYQPAEAKQLKLNPDHVVRLEFIEFVVGETNLKSEKVNVTSKDSVRTGTAKIDGKNLDVYGLVNATVTRFHKSVRSRGLLSMEIYDYKSKKVLLRDELPGEFIWDNKWASFNGDERALSKLDLEAVKFKEQMPPPPQQMFIEFCKPIYDQFSTRIKRFYDKY
jgi:tetratricopeptide (TPR) repeat protein